MSGLKMACSWILTLTQFPCRAPWQRPCEDADLYEHSQSLWAAGVTCKRSQDCLEGLTGLLRWHKLDASEQETLSVRVELGLKRPDFCVRTRCFSLNRFLEIFSLKPQTSQWAVFLRLMKLGEYGALLVWSCSRVHKKSSSKQKRCPVDYSEVTLFESDM